MSRGDSADDGDLGRVRFIRMEASETFDGQDRVISRAAYDLQVRATAHSASCGHPGFVPDDYLEHLDGLSIETTITADELCTSGMWQRVDGGFRVLDWEAVEVCLDQLRQLSGEDQPALAWEAEREASVARGQADGGHPAVRGLRNPSARVEVVAPGLVARRMEAGPCAARAGAAARPGQWYLLVKGVATCNGYGDPIDATRAGQIAWASGLPVFAQVHTAGFYDDAGFCPDCDAPYCYRHWHVSESGYGYCPRGHGKSLDPHW